MIFYEEGKSHSCQLIAMVISTVSSTLSTDLIYKIHIATFAYQLVFPELSYK